MRKILILIFAVIPAMLFSQDKPTAEIVSVSKVVEKGKHRIKVVYNLQKLNDVMSIQLVGSTLKDIDIIEGERVFYDDDQLLSQLEYHFVITMNGNRQSIITDPKTFKID